MIEIGLIGEISRSQNETMTLLWFGPSVLRFIPLYVCLTNRAICWSRVLATPNEGLSVHLSIQEGLSVHPSLYYLAKSISTSSIQLNFLSINAYNICKIQLLLWVTYLGINFSFHAPWYAIVKQLKVLALSSPNHSTKKNGTKCFVKDSDSSNEKNIAKSMTVWKLCKRSSKWVHAGCSVFIR